MEEFGGWGEGVSLKAYFLVLTVYDFYEYNITN